MGTAAIRLEAVTKTFPGQPVPAVTSLDLEVDEGEIVMLVGPSGCGKTTTLKMINRLVEPSAGTITVAGRDVRTLPPHELRRGIGYVIQQVGLFPHRTVAQNIATVPVLLGWDPRRVRSRVDELLEQVRLDPQLADRYPAELSGGQRQRAGVARALAADPPVLLMDEPFGAVDPLVRAELQEQLLVLQRELAKTVVFVTHDIDEAIRLGDRVAILNVGGILEQYAPPATILADPATAFVSAFLGDERGLRRLALLPVAGLSLPRGPMVTLDDARPDAEAAMAAHGTDWVGVLDGDRLLGWIRRDELPAAGDLRGVVPRPFRVTVPAAASLRGALDAIVSTRNQVAVVCDVDDRYVGLLTVDLLSQELAR